MDFSSNYHIRKDKLNNLQVPTITETKENLGPKLADIFFKSCPESLQAEMSISSSQKLNGPGPDLWTSPSDLLINKLVLKPPLTNKHIKALTHEGILEIGLQVELKKKMLQEEELKKALYEQEVWLRFIAAKEREKAVMDAVAREQELFRLKLIQLNEEFEQLVQNLLSRVEEKLRETYEEMLAVETEKILREQEAIWTKKIEEAVEETVNTLTSKFLNELELQEKEIVAVFEARMEAEKEMYARSLETERDAYRELVKQLKHNIYCNNIANLMYMLCTERRKCFLEQTQIVANYERKILVMENTKEQMTFDLDEMKKECDKLMLKIKIREECMTRVLEQFQKFINFALRAVPAQAEFLLDMNKMMTFELTQAIAKLGHVHPVKQVMPWQAVKVPDVRVMTSEMDDLGDKYHDCLNEEDPPQNDDDEITSDEVYSVKYKKKLYVREDFRNMISNGEEITATNMIWNKDVENLINLLKNTSIEESIGSLNKEIKSQVSNVHFNANPKLPNNGSFGIGLLAAQDSIELQKSGKVSHSLSSEVYIKQPSCAILASTDSLTIVKNVERAPSKLTDDRSKELIVKHFSCDTINLSVSRKNRDRASMDSPCATISEETFKLGSRRKYKVCEEVCEKFNDKATSTGLLNEQEETYKIESNQELHSSSRKKKKFESLLVLHKDSLELTRSAMHVEESRFKDIVRAGPLYKSGVCLLNMPIADIVQDIDFEPVAKVYRYHTVHPNKPEVAQTTPSIKEEEVEKPAERDNFLEKPGVAKVLGRHGREHLQTNQEFTVHRIHSIVDMLKKDDSLIRMFTRCNQ